MNLTRCSKGHFYDADANPNCPHCMVSNGAETQKLVRSEKESDVTMKLVDGDVPTGGGPNKQPKDEGVTIRFDTRKIGRDPAVGWLLCTEGKHIGEDFRLTTGKNFIGRDSGMHVALVSDKSVSREKHAIVVYDPKSLKFMIQQGEARELCYLNDEVVLSPQVLKRNDIISVGDSKLMFFPGCDTVFNWGMIENKENDNTEE